MPKEKQKKVTGIYIWWLCKQWFYGVLCMTVSTMSIPHCRKWNQSCSSFWDKSYSKWSPWGTRLSAASAGGFSVPLPVRTPFKLVKFQLIRLWKKLSGGSHKYQERQRVQFETRCCWKVIWSWVLYHYRIQRLTIFRILKNSIGLGQNIFVL